MPIGDWSNGVISNADGSFLSSLLQKVKWKMGPVRLSLGKRMLLERIQAEGYPFVIFLGLRVDADEI